MNRFFIEHNQDNDELDDITRQLVRERDHERLKRMTFYCFTNECLRDYMLRYFGEYGGNYCGNCSNCMTQFEEVDITEMAEALTGCIREAGQRYGINVIIDTVHGANTAKIRQYRMDQSAFYGKLPKIPVYKLRQVMNHLLVDGYIRLTNDDYMIAKLTEKARGILERKEVIMMKMAKEQEQREKKESRPKKKFPAAMQLKAEDEQLFERLRKLRTEIAREENVPPYIVFSDKSLIHMCILKPGNREEMLKVSGVGEFKYEKYGERFLEELKLGTG